jgi:hypothetical protein
MSQNTSFGEVCNGNVQRLSRIKTVEQNGETQKVDYVRHYTVLIIKLFGAITYRYYFANYLKINRLLALQAFLNLN